MLNLPLEFIFVEDTISPRQKGLHCDNDIPHFEGGGILLLCLTGTEHEGKTVSVVLLHVAQPILWRCDGICLKQLHLPHPAEPDCTLLRRVNKLHAGPALPIGRGRQPLQAANARGVEGLKDKAVYAMQPKAHQRQFVT